jgi:hypothetical protein
VQPEAPKIQDDRLVDILDLALYQVEQMFHEKVQQTLNSIK